MYIRYILPLFVFTLFSISNAQAQAASDIVVQLNAQVQTAPPQIKLYWKKLAGAVSYEIYRKAKTGNSWGTSIATVLASDSTYTDNNVIADSAYEYKVVKQGGTVTAYGYIYAGVRTPAIHNRGALMLLVDNTFSTACAAELTTLANDLRGDGWEVIRTDLARTVKDTAIRNAIGKTYAGNSRLNAVLIVGHLAVPYSGSIAPDGHVPDHEGAWPADVYYADVNDAWSDAFVNITGASRVQNQNIPGDGKWDQSTIPGALELQVGRIDFANMPAFAKTEEQLMKNYLNRSHQYKLHALSIKKRVLIDDNFGYFSGEAFSQNAWRLAPLAGVDSMKPADFLTGLNTDSYQWAYACGGGSHTSAGGVGSTSDVAGKNINAIFIMMFGSYFGDWDAQNNFLRSVLCADVPALTAHWAGRPNAFMHHMALGENIGYSVRLSQNNGSLYAPTNYGAQSIHNSLMGDLSLRTDYIAPPASVILTSSATLRLGAVLSWAPSPDAVDGYYVYRSATEYGRYELRSEMITGTTYTDSFGSDGTYFYMVRAVKLQSTPSGNYYNLSLGEAKSAPIYYHSLGIDDAAPYLQVSLYPNPAKNRLQLRLANCKAGNIGLSVFDVHGRILYERSETLAAGINLVDIPVAQLPAGNYILSIHNNEGTITHKWIKSE